MILHDIDSPKKIISLQESTRKRIAEYLHGHVQAKLLELHQHLQKCQALIPVDPTEASKVLERVTTDLATVRDNDIRQIGHDLYPSIISMGLLPALRSLSNRFEPVVEMHLIGGDELHDLERYEDDLLNDELKIAVYRIAEEALNNVLRHSGAGEAYLVLLCTAEGMLSLTFKDSGRGFDITKVSKGLGFTAIRDYAGSLGGTCDVQSTPGKGTEIKVSFPLPMSSPMVREMAHSGV